MTHPKKSYILCSTPRTGSTLLCSLLRNTNRAGVPESYFRSQDVEARAHRWHIRQSNGSINFHDYLNCVLEKGRTPNGVFAVRIMWETMNELLANLRGAGLSGSDLTVLKNSLGPLQFVHLQRRDVVAQAVSRLRAEQTNIWHITSKASPESKKPNNVFYDREALQRFVGESDAHNLSWNQWFESNGVNPLRIAYEDLDQNNQAELQRVLEFIGEQPSEIPAVARNVRMADALSREWAERYRSETSYHE